MSKTQFQLSDDTLERVAVLASERGLTVDALINFWIRTSISTKARRKPYALDDKLRFGRHLGLPMDTVIRADPDYVGWCIENLEHFELTAEAHKVYRKMREANGDVDIPLDEVIDEQEMVPFPSCPMPHVPNRTTIAAMEESLRDSIPQHGVKLDPPSRLPTPPLLKDITVHRRPVQTWTKIGVKYGTYGIDASGKTRRVYFMDVGRWRRVPKAAEKAILSGQPEIPLSF